MKGGKNNWTTPRRHTPKLPRTRPKLQVYFPTLFPQCRPQRQNWQTTGIAAPYLKAPMQHDGKKTTIVRLDLYVTADPLQIQKENDTKQ